MGRLASVETDTLSETPCSCQTELNNSHPVRLHAPPSARPGACNRKDLVWVAPTAHSPPSSLIPPASADVSTSARRRSVGDESLWFASSMSLRLELPAESQSQTSYRQSSACSHARELLCDSSSWIERKPIYLLDGSSRNGFPWSTHGGCSLPKP